MTKLLCGPEGRGPAPAHHTRGDHAAAWPATHENLSNKTRQLILLILGGRGEVGTMLETALLLCFPLQMRAHKFC